TVSWEVFTTGPRKAKNVILFIGDGMSAAHRTAARILSAGISEGKYHGGLAMDAMPNMALVGTAGVDSIITDSANSMSAYTTGHKSSVNALGVYADRTPNTLDDPKVETLTSLIKRTGKIAVGVVTNTEVEDATPAAMVAHTRRRSDYDQIVGMLHESGVDVLMGGGGARRALPAEVAGGRARNGRDRLRGEFRRGGLRAREDGAREEGGDRRSRHAPAPGPLPSEQHGRRPRPQVLEAGDRPVVPGAARPRRHGPDRADRAGPARRRLRADGRVGADRQVLASARLGTRGHGHDHARPRRRGGQGVRGGTARHRHPGHGPPHA